MTYLLLLNPNIEIDFWHEIPVTHYWWSWQKLIIVRYNVILVETQQIQNEKTKIKPFSLIKSIGIILRIGNFFYSHLIKLASSLVPHSSAFLYYSIFRTHTNFTIIANPWSRTRKPRCSTTPRCSSRRR